ncbi:hypothetical protein HanHA300_Chr15g0588691 [Helianthus annuus]|nr:hypothetical protein HanHA300_Chr15g0588691 [Helianthus annuus]KAJ0650766.1 hypothetical protein HanLR1_Chr15g0599481 [Helianthus annuus]KAJ0654521.1 hypothetical protein HanOQP8_Chr15g0595941 [Helianthus annuus]
MADVIPRGHGETELGIHQIRIFFGEGHTRLMRFPQGKLGGKPKTKSFAGWSKPGGGGGSLTFDRDVTYTPVGVSSDLFAHEAGMYMWRTISFDRMGWEKLLTPYRDAIMNHLKENFNFDEVEQDLDAHNMQGGIRHVLMKRYSGRKNDAKKEFLTNGGFDDVERARAYHPKDMPYENWLKTVDHFLDPINIARCEANTIVRQRQQFPNHGGATSYSSTAYKHGLKRLDTYRKTHTDKDGNFVDPVAEQNYVKCEIMCGESGGSQPPNEAVVFQIVFGDRRGWFRGLGHKPSNMPSNPFGAQPQTPQPLSEEYVSSLFQTPAFVNQLESYLAARGKQATTDDDYDDADLFDKDDEDDDE